MPINIPPKDGAPAFLLVRAKRNPNDMAVVQVTP
jgi:hypothetical protein